jgi:hypothetical protein
MKLRRLLVIACGGIALAAVLILALSAYWERKQTPFQNAPKLLIALQAFSHDQAAAGRRLPPEISLQELLRGGYLTTNDVRAFQGMEVSLSTQADESQPQLILARACTADGQMICLMGDGSVQQLSRSRYEEMRTTLGQRDGAANGSQPIRADTNSTSSAAGSRRLPLR